jgi:hypothetical protein
MKLRTPTILVLLCMLVGCSATYQTAVDGRSLLFKPSYPHFASPGGSTPDEAAVNMAGNLFLVSPKAIKWAHSDSHLNDPQNWQSCTLPATWHSLQLIQTPENFLVLLDGQQFTTIH